MPDLTKLGNMRNSDTSLKRGKQKIHNILKISTIWIWLTIEN